MITNSIIYCIYYFVNIFLNDLQGPPAGWGQVSRCGARTGEPLSEGLLSVLTESRQRATKGKGCFESPLPFGNPTPQRPKGSARLEIPLRVGPRLLTITAAQRGARKSPRVLSPLARCSFCASAQPLNSPGVQGPQPRAVLSPISVRTEMGPPEGIPNQSPPANAGASSPRGLFRVRLAAHYIPYGRRWTSRCCRTMIY